MSQIRMFKPSAGLQGIKDFIIEAVETAGPNPCPPMVVGVGIGGTFDKCALLAKKALMRPLDSSNPDPFYADLEKEMLEKINELASDLRDSAERRQRSDSILRLCRHTSRECPARLISTVT